MAKGKLDFTLSEVWVVCREGVHRKDQYSEARLSNLSSYILYPNLSFLGYGRHIGNYSRRTLSDQLDAYYAFTRILNVLYPDKRVIYGLSEQYFDKALLWGLLDTSVGLELLYALLMASCYMAAPICYATATLFMAHRFRYARRWNLRSIGRMIYEWA